MLAYAALSIVRAQLLVLFDEDQLGLVGKDGAIRLCETNVALELFRAELGLDGLVTVLVHADDVLCEMAINLLVALVQDDEEEIETRHDGGRHVDVGPKRGLAVITPTDRVCCCEDTRARVQGGLNARLGDGDGLLFHGFVNGDLISNIHLVKFVDSADAVISKHQSTGFDGEFTRLLVLDDCRCETRSRRSLARCVNGTRCERADVFEELGLGCGRVANDADVDIATKLHALCCRLVDTRHELKQQTLFDIFVPVNHRGDGVDETRVNTVTVNHVTKVIDFSLVHGPEHDLLRLLYRILALCLISPSEGVDDIHGVECRGLARRCRVWYHHAPEKGQTVCEVADTKCLEARHSAATGVITTTGIPVISYGSRPYTGKTELAHIRYHDEGACEDALLSCLGPIDNLTTKNNVHRSWHAAGGNLGTVFLNSHLLPVDECTATNVELPCNTVLASLVGALVRLRVSEGLLDIRDDASAGFADERRQ